MTFVSREARRTCAVESSFVDITHFMTRAIILTGGGVTTVALTGWIRTGLLGNSLEEAFYQPLYFTGYILTEDNNNNKLY